MALAAAGLGLGLFATALAVDRGWDPGTVGIGPWTTRPGIGTTAIDPYARARLALTGQMPLAANEGLTFRAETDDTGYRLVLGCTYRLSGSMGPTRFWTLTALDAAGRAMDDGAHRSAFTSATVIRDTDGALAIDVGPEARPGNWLPTAGRGAMELVLRFYDTPLADARADLALATLPAIARQSCTTSVSAS